MAGPIARGDGADHADAAIAGQLAGELQERRAVEEIHDHVQQQARIQPVAPGIDHAVAVEGEFEIVA